MSQSTSLYISDNSGRQMFRTICSTEFKAPEIRNLERHLDMAKRYPHQYKFLDIDSARIYEDGVALMSDDELLAELMS